MKGWLAILLLLVPGGVAAENVVPVTTIRPNTILSAQDLKVENISVSGGVSNPSELIGMEARVVLYAGRPILRANVSPPAIVNRNEIVKIIYASGPLRITTAGRAMDRGALNDVIRVMNLNSRTLVVGRVTQNGFVEIAGNLGDDDN